MYRNRDRSNAPTPIAKRLAAARVRRNSAPTWSLPATRALRIAGGLLAFAAVAAAVVPPAVPHLAQFARFVSVMLG